MDIKDIKVGDIVPPSEIGEGGVVIKVNSTWVFVDCDGDGHHDELWLPEEIKSVNPVSVTALRDAFVDALAREYLPHASVALREAAKNLRDALK